MSLKRNLRERVDVFIGADGEATLIFDEDGDIVCTERRGMVAIGERSVEMFVEWCRQVVGVADEYGKRCSADERAQRFQPELVAVMRRLSHLEERADQSEAAQRRLERAARCLAGDEEAAS